MAHINLISVAEPKDSKGRITRFPFALPIILRGMEKTKHTWDIVDTHLHKYSFEDLLKRTETKSMDSKIFGISGWSHNYLQIKHLTKTIRARYSDAKIIVGGIIGGNYNAVLSNT
ncbi:uncharacterized protein METZ01_LOCUS479111, partial [marine metagenome]